MDRRARWLARTPYIRISLAFLGFSNPVLRGWRPLSIQNYTLHFSILWWRWLRLWRSICVRIPMEGDCPEDRTITNALLRGIMLLTGPLWKQFMADQHGSAQSPPSPKNTLEQGPASLPILHRLVRSPAAWIVACFAISRFGYYLAGIRFQTDILWNNFQFIDVALLRTRLWESIFYFHMQPPLMNILVGTLVKCFPDHYGEAMHGVYMATGLASSLLLFRLLRYLAVSTTLALLFTLVFTINPGTVLYENFPTYEPLIMFLLLGWAIVFRRLIRSPGFWQSFVFFGFYACLAWLRALYHLYFMLALIPLIAWFVQTKRRDVVAGAVIPCLSVLALYMKNLVVFGLFGASSWFGFANSTTTLHQLTDDEREHLIMRGDLDDFGRMDGIFAAADYAPYVKVSPTGIPVLYNPVKSTGAQNTNHLVYLKANLLYQKVSRQVLIHAPQAYLRSVVIAWFCYFRPPTDFFQFEPLREHIRKFDRALNIVEFGQFREATGKGLRALKGAGNTFSLALYTGTFLIVLFPLLWAWGLISVWRSVRDNLGRVRIGLTTFVIGNIVFTMMTVNFLSSFENNRYRFPTDCLYVVLLATWIQAAIRSRKAARVMSR